MSAVGAQELEPGTASAELMDLARLVDHRESIQATEPVEKVYVWFQQHQQEYIGVLQGRQFLGLVSRGQIGFLLGARYGFAIHGRHPVSVHLMAEPLVLQEGQPLLTALEAALSRPGDRFYDDAALVDAAGNY